MQHGSFIITSVLPVKQWNEYLNDALMADSILDRLVCQATARLRTKRGIFEPPE